MKAPELRTYDFTVYCAYCGTGLSVTATETGPPTAKMGFQLFDQDRRMKHYSVSIEFEMEQSPTAHTCAYAPIR